jgi:phosphate-selective porin OprO/OprP
MAPGSALVAKVRELTENPRVLNVDVTVRELPWVGNFRIGNMVTPIGLEHQQFAGFTDFMEFSYLFDAYYGQFSNGFAPGVMIFNQTADKNATFAVGFFKQLNNAFGFGVGDGQNQVTGRATWTPWYDEPTCLAWARAFYTAVRLAGGP